MNLSFQKFHQLFYLNGCEYYCLMPKFDVGWLCPKPSNLCAGFTAYLINSLLIYFLLALEFYWCGKLAQDTERSQR